MKGRLVLISPYDPAAGFNVGHAMQRNKLIYALADAALVVTSDFEKGGTWAGAIEQLERLHFVPVFVRKGADTGRGNSALLNRGGMPWPNPYSGDELGAALVAATHAATMEPRQDSLLLAVREEPASYEAAPGEKPREVMAEKVEIATVEVKPAPDVELLNSVRDILRHELVDGRTAEEVATLLAVTKPQAKAWLTRLIAEATVEKVKKSKPARFRTVRTSDRLL